MMFRSNYRSAKTREGTYFSFSPFLWIFSVTDTYQVRNYVLEKVQSWKTVELFWFYLGQNSVNTILAQDMPDFWRLRPEWRLRIFLLIAMLMWSKFRNQFEISTFWWVSNYFWCSQTPRADAASFSKKVTPHLVVEALIIYYAILYLISHHEIQHGNLDAQWSLKWWANTEIPSTVTSWTIDHHLSVRRYSGRGTHSRSLPFSCGLHLNIQRRECAFTAVTFIEHSHN